MKNQSALLTALLIVLSLGCDSQIAPSEGNDVTQEAGSLTADKKVGSSVSDRMTATMQVGRSDVGTDFSPPGVHDASTHAKDAIRPRAVVIAAGGTVTFNLAAFHSLALYEAGTQPEDIDTSLLEGAGLPFDFPPVINDDDGRLARTPVAFPADEVFEFTFETPGVYLVICEVLPHFTIGKMYAYVRVQ